MANETTFDILTYFDERILTDKLKYLLQGGVMAHDPDATMKNLMLLCKQGVEEFMMLSALRKTLKLLKIENHIQSI